MGVNTLFLGQTVSVPRGWGAERLWEAAGNKHISPCFNRLAVVTGKYWLPIWWRGENVVLQTLSPFVGLT